MFYSGSAVDAIPELKKGNFQGLAFHRNGLIAAGKVGANTPINFLLSTLLYTLIYILYNIHHVYITSNLYKIMSLMFCLQKVLLAIY